MLTLVNFVNQLTKASHVKGEAAELGTKGYNLGPYFRDISTDANAASNDVGCGPVGTSAWHYDQAIGDFHANDSDETRIF